MIIEVDTAAGEFRKRGETADEADRLHNEAQVLTIARHPGVVQLLGWDGAALRVGLVHGEPLSRWAPATVDDVDRIAVALANTLADLHDIGVVHGAIRGGHIVIDGVGQPFLCSFGRGATGCGADSGPARSDVVALARALLPVAEAGRPLHRALSDAVAAGPNAPLARRLAAILAMPGAPRRQRHALVPMWCAATLTALATALAVPLIIARLTNPAPDPASQNRPAAAAATATATASAAARPAVAARPVATARPACPAVDRGCRALPRPAGVIDTSRGRYRIGRPDDLVVLGRWRCAAPLPALLRPATGEVWAWDEWAAAGGPRPAQLLTRIPGAHSVEVDPGPGGCDRLRVRRPDGQAIVIQPFQPGEPVGPVGPVQPAQSGDRAGPVPPNRAS